MRLGATQQDQVTESSSICMGQVWEQAGIGQFTTTTASVGVRKGCRASQVGCNTRHCTLGLGLEVSQAGLDCNTCRHKLELGTGWKEACYSIHKGILRQGRPCQTRLGHPLAGSEPHAGCGWGLQCWTTALTSECKNWHWGQTWLGNATATVCLH